MFRLRVPAVPDSLERVHGLVRRLTTAAALPEEPAFRLRLAAEELFTNAVRHGSGAARPPGRVTVEAGLTDELVWIRLIDCAPRFDPLRHLPDPPARGGPAAEPDGLGLWLTRWAATSAEHRYEGGANRTTITVSRAAATGAPALERRRTECAC